MITSYLFDIVVVLLLWLRETPLETSSRDFSMFLLLFCFLCWRCFRFWAGCSSLPFKKHMCVFGFSLILLLQLFWSYISGMFIYILMTISKILIETQLIKWYRLVLVANFRLKMNIKFATIFDSLILFYVFSFFLEYFSA